MVYRGAIDNAWDAIGRRRPNAERQFLAEAIQAEMTGKPVAIARTQPVGCLFEDAAKPDADAKVTYCRDIAPIRFARCLNCHREGQVAPFALANCDQTAKHAAQIVEVTQQRIMPPWRPNRGLATSATGEASSESSAHHTELDGYVYLARLDLRPRRAARRKAAGS